MIIIIKITIIIIIKNNFQLLNLNFYPYNLHFFRFLVSFEYFILQIILGYGNDKLCDRPLSISYLRRHHYVLLPIIIIDNC